MDIVILYVVKTMIIDGHFGITNNLEKDSERDSEYQEDFNPRSKV